MIYIKCVIIGMEANYQDGVIIFLLLVHLAQCCVPYRNYSFDLQYKSNDWFLYETQH